MGVFRGLLDSAMVYDFFHAPLEYCPHALGFFFASVVSPVLRYLGNGMTLIQCLSTFGGSLPGSRSGSDCFMFCDKLAVDLLAFRNSIGTSFFTRTVKRSGLSEDWAKDAVHRHTPFSM